jgi:hypothetical protein
VLSAFGDPEVLHTTGMASPYPYLWSLPSRILDPDLTVLRRVLASPDAPTWVVVRSKRTFDRLGAHGVRPMIEARYVFVGRVCGRWIYQHRGLERPPLDRAGTCGGLVLP